MKSRFAPSPTGPFHIGGLRTALLVKVLCAKKGGQSILRIEDTDVQRSTKAYEQEILDSLDWAGIQFDNANKDYPRQSQRLNIYNSAIDSLIKSGKAYYCYMTSQELDDLRTSIRTHNKENPNNYIQEKYDNRYRPENWKDGVSQDIKDKNPNPVIRLIMPTTGNTVWEDGHRTKISIENEKLDDLIIRRSDGSPTYNFVAVIDDVEMNITDVIRGEDHIANTPKQIQIQNILKSIPKYSGSEKINYTHLPLMLNPDGSKISKSALAKEEYAQKVADGKVVPATVTEYRQMGILPDALINYLLLISAQKTAQKLGKEIFSTDEFMYEFTASDLSTKPACFDLKKLLSINAKYIEAYHPEYLKAQVALFDRSVEDKIQDLDFAVVSPDIKKRSKTLADVAKYVVEVSNFKQHVKDNYDNFTDFVKEVLNATSEEEFNKIINNEVEKTQGKKADVFKKFREEAGYTSVLPFFPVISAATLKDGKKSLKM